MNPTTEYEWGWVSRYVVDGQVDDHNGETVFTEASARAVVEAGNKREERMYGPDGHFPENAECRTIYTLRRRPKVEWEEVE